MKISSVMLTQQLTQMLFYERYIVCEPVFSFIPYSDQWRLDFPTTFKYLYLHIHVMVDRCFMQNINFKSFQKFIIETRDQVAKEYNYYFSALWC